MYTDYTFTLERQDGGVVEAKGAWVLCHTGYHKWRETICGFKRTAEPIRKSFAQRCESIRKDVERTFGIIKKRHMMVDYPVRFKDVRDVEAVFRVCCVMHSCTTCCCIMMGWTQLDSMRRTGRRLTTSWGCTKPPRGMEWL